MSMAAVTATTSLRVSASLFSYPRPMIRYCTRCQCTAVEVDGVKLGLLRTRTGSGSGAGFRSSGLRHLWTTIPLKVNLPRIVVEPSATLKDAFEDPDFKPRKGPGHFNIKKVCLPPKLRETAATMIKIESLPDLLSAGMDLHNHLLNRKPPIEEDEYQAKAVATEAFIKEKHAYMDQFLSEKQKENLEQSDFSKVKRRLKQIVYHWKPMDYTRTLAFNYLVGRTPGEYASLYRIFFEIACRDPDFKPETLLDFGSGVGSVVWSANQFWKKSLKEHMCIDSSDEMSNLAELLLKGGSSKYKTEYPGIYFRRLLPTSTHIKYDMTVASHTLLELSSLKERIEAVDTLWKKTNKYMILVEVGTNAGFRVLNEVRDYILQLHERYANEDEENLLDFETGHMFSPCPHDSPCPRLRTDETPCNFSIRYETLMPFSKRQEGVEVYSYLVFKKGPRDKDDPRWPRIVQNPLRRPRHVVCRLCTKYGKISEVVITKGKFQRQMYRSARTSLGGDLLPVEEVQLDADSDSKLKLGSGDLDDADSDANRGPGSESDAETEPVSSSRREST